MTPPPPARPSASSSSAPRPTSTLDGRRLRGLIPYGVESRDLGGWREVMEPGCLRRRRPRRPRRHRRPRRRAARPPPDHAGDRGPRRRAALVRRAAREPRRRPRGRRARRPARQLVADDRRPRPLATATSATSSEVAELRDVAVVTDPAYPSAAAELPIRRSGPMTAAPPEPAERAVPDPTRRRRGSLRVEDRHRPAAGARRDPHPRGDAARVRPASLATSRPHATADPVEPDAPQRLHVAAHRDGDRVHRIRRATVISTDRHSDP